MTRTVSLCLISIAILSLFGLAQAQAPQPTFPVQKPTIKQKPIKPINDQQVEIILEAAKNQPTRISVRSPFGGTAPVSESARILVEFTAVAAWETELTGVQFALKSPTGQTIAQDLVCARDCGRTFEVSDSIDLDTVQNGLYRLFIQVADSEKHVINRGVDFTLSLTAAPSVPPVEPRKRSGFAMVAQADLMERHPRLAPLPAIHFDHYNSSVTDAPVSDFGSLRVQEVDFAGGAAGTGACLNFMTDPRGNLIGFCGHRDGFLQLKQAEYRITLLDKGTFEQIDDITVAEDITLSSHGCEDSSDDRAPLYLGYFVMDNLGRALITKDDNVTYFIRASLDGRRLETVDRIDFNTLALPGMRGDFRLDPKLNRVAQVLPDYEDGYWFMGQGTTRSSSFVGHINSRKQVDYFKWLNSSGLGEEKIENGMAIDSSGLYVLSDHALYKFKIRDGSGQIVFRQTYARAHRNQCKPGTFAHRGSGSTPTLLGDDLIAFTDNADVQINVVVLDRTDSAAARDRVICEVPVFEEYASANENSLIGYRNSLIVQIWFNAPDKITGVTDEMEDGIWRIDVAEDRSSCRVIWDEDDIGSTATARLSTKTGLLYLPIENWPAERLELAALDFETGREVAPRLHLGNIDIDEYILEVRQDQPDNEQILMLPLYVLQSGELVQPVYAGVKRIAPGFR